jgi:hypothetical protein
MRLAAHSLQEAGPQSGSKWGKMGPSSLCFLAFYFPTNREDGAGEKGKKKWIYKTKKLQNLPGCRRVE